MRILFLNYEYPPLGGGAGNATKYLLRQFAQMSNVEVDLVTSSVGAARVEDIGGGVRVHYVDIGKSAATLTHQSGVDLLRYTWSGYKKAAELMGQQKYDFIHAFFGVPCGAMAWRLSRKFGVPYIVSLRGADVPGFSDRYERIYPFLTPIIKGVWCGSVSVVANSTGLRDLALQTNSNQQIDIIYNGVDTEVFVPAVNYAPVGGDNKRPFVVFMSARLMRRKGFRYGIDAFEKLRGKYPEQEFKMIIAGGDGDAASELRKQVGDEHLTDSVLFTGHLSQSELITAYQGADVFVLPSLNEGMSNNMLEALACGLPVVMTKVGGSEILGDGVNGYLVERESADSIVTAVEKLLTKPEELVKMRTTNRTLAQSLSWHSVAKKYEKLYYDKFGK